MSKNAHENVGLNSGTSRIGKRWHQAETKNQAMPKVPGNVRLQDGGGYFVYAAPKNIERVNQ